MSTPEQNEKSFEVNERLTSSSPSTSSHAQQHPAAGAVADDDKMSGGSDVDAAWVFLNEHRDVAGVDAVDLKKLRARIDWRIVPIMFGCYTMQFLDKVIYNVSSSLGPACPDSAVMHQKRWGLTCIFPHYSMPPSWASKRTWT